MGPALLVGLQWASPQFEVGVQVSTHEALSPPPTARHCGKTPDMLDGKSAGHTVFPGVHGSAHTPVEMPDPLIVMLCSSPWHLALYGSP